MAIDGKPVKGRGASFQPANRFMRHHYGVVEPLGIDEPEDNSQPTRYVFEHPKTILNKVTSPDLGLDWSLNPYQGCEHGCAYCYARPTHEYWGYSAGLDFERVIIIKRNAPELLEKALRSRNWKGEVISISGNTDCYQPVERTEGITRELLRVCAKYKQAVGMITKNALVLRDIDLLSGLAAQGLASVAISFTTMDEELRRVLEPRTSTAANRLQAMKELSRAGVPVRAMIAPIIPALNDSEVPSLLKAAAEAGASSAGYTVVRTNGAVEGVFREWLEHHFPDRAAKVIAQISAVHGNAMHDSTFGRRLSGEGPFAENIARVFRVFEARYFRGRHHPSLNTGLFRIPPAGQLDLFAGQ